MRTSSTRKSKGGGGLESLAEHEFLRARFLVRRQLRGFIVPKIKRVHRPGDNHPRTPTATPTARPTTTATAVLSTSTLNPTPTPRPSSTPRPTHTTRPRTPTNPPPTNPPSTPHAPTTYPFISSSYLPGTAFTIRPPKRNRKK